MLILILMLILMLIQMLILMLIQMLILSIYKIKRIKKQQTIIQHTNKNIK